MHAPVITPAYYMFCNELSFIIVLKRDELYKIYVCEALSCYVYQYVDVLSNINIYHIDIIDIYYNEQLIHATITAIDKVIYMCCIL